jgi:hypothetical protein
MLYSTVPVRREKAARWRENGTEVSDGRAFWPGCARTSEQSRETKNQGLVLSEVF